MITTFAYLCFRMYCDLGLFDKVEEILHNDTYIEWSSDEDSD